MKENKLDPIKGNAMSGKGISITLPFILYTAFLGAYSSATKFNEAVASKSLGAGKLWVTLIVMCWPVGNMTSLWWAHLLVGRNQRLIIALSGCLISLCFVSGFFLSHVMHLFILFFLSSMAIAVVWPAENRTLQQFVPAGKRGSLFGAAKGLHMLVAAGFSLAAGWYMDAVEGGYRHVYTAAGVISLAGFLFFASIPTGRNDSEEPRRINRDLLLLPLRNIWMLLRRRPDYLRFEAAFMVYGFAFMISLPVEPLYLVEDLGFDYSRFGMARIMIPMLIMAMGVPLFGKVFDRSTPHRLCAKIFMVLALYPLCLIAAGWVEGFCRLGLVFLAFSVFGVALSGVVVVWSLSSLRFAGNEDAGVYHSVHVAATGLRGLIAPLIGYFIMKYWGKVEALACSSILWMLAAFTMMLMRYIDIRCNQNHPLHAE